MGSSSKIRQDVGVADGKRRDTSSLKENSRGGKELDFGPSWALRQIQKTNGPDHWPQYPLFRDVGFFVL
ncbi:hypothetical protein [Magnetococcus sp. PR-3]|uniref:hypothetical protein n=1 Tax=Magnetococcus sp. PR-3 TaxID=3120355 RepID=UPI002FCDF487